MPVFWEEQYVRTPVLAPEIGHEARTRIKRQMKRYMVTVCRYCRIELL